MLTRSSVASFLLLTCLLLAVATPQLVAQPAPPATPEQLTNRRYALANDATAVGWNPAMLGTVTSFRSYDFLAGFGLDRKFALEKVPFGIYGKVGPIALGTTGTIGGDTTDHATYYAGFGLPIDDDIQLGVAAHLFDIPGSDLLKEAEYTLSGTWVATEDFIAGASLYNLGGAGDRGIRLGLDGTFVGEVGHFGIIALSDPDDTANGKSSWTTKLTAGLNFSDGGLAMSATYNLTDKDLRIGVEIIPNRLTVGALTDWDFDGTDAYTGANLFARYSNTSRTSSGGYYDPVASNRWQPENSYTPVGLEYSTATTDAGPSANALVKSCVAGGDTRFATPGAIVNELRKSGNDYLRLAQKLEQISPRDDQIFSAIANRYYLRQQARSRELKSGDSLAILSKQGYSIGVQSVDNSKFPLVSVVMQVADGNGRNVPGLGINDFQFRDTSIRIVAVQPTDATLSVPVDIVLMIDCSGSMGDEIDAVRNNVQSFVKNMESRGADYRIGGVLYGSMIYDTLHPTNDLDRFRDFADQAAAIGGDEISSLAIREAASMRFRPDAQRVLVMITDDWVMQENSRLTESDLTEMLWDKGARLYSIQNPCRNNNAITTRLTLGREYDIQSSFNSILDELGTDITTTYKLVYESKLKQEEAAPPAIPAVLRGRVTEAKTGRPVAAELLMTDANGRRYADANTAQTDGSYQLTIDEPVKLSARLNAERFRPASGDIDLSRIKPGDTVVRDFVMERLATVLSGRIFDENGKIVAGKVKVEDAAIGKELTTLQTDAGGYYETEITPGLNYRLTPSATGYDGFTEAFDARDVEPGSKAVQNLRVTRAFSVTDTTPFVLRNVLFDYDKADLKPESMTELDRLVKFLKENPSVRIEVGAHTDAQGNDAYNLNLSDRRAKSVMDYLVTQAIDRRRLSSRGYGETAPIASNDSEEGRALNRRVEFRIVR